MPARWCGGNGSAERNGRLAQRLLLRRPSVLLHTSGAPSARFARKVERVFVFELFQTRYLVSPSHPDLLIARSGKLRNLPRRG